MQRLADIQISDADLAAARAGDAQARAELFRQLAPPTLGIIRRLVRHSALAEDLLQDTLIAMFEHLAEYRGEAPFGAWVRSIAVSRCLMTFRSPWQRARVALESFSEDAQPWPVEPEGRTAELIDLCRRTRAALIPSCFLVFLGARLCQRRSGWHSRSDRACAGGRDPARSGQAPERALDALCCGDLCLVARVRWTDLSALAPSVLYGRTR